MPLCPDAETVRAYEMLEDAPERLAVTADGVTWMRHDRTSFGRAWEMEVKGDVWTLYHYGTRILTADERSGRTDVHGAWSRSDVDKMNGLCRLLFGYARFSLRDGEVTED